MTRRQPKSPPLRANRPAPALAALAAAFALLLLPGLAAGMGAKPAEAPQANATTLNSAPGTTPETTPDTAPETAASTASTAQPWLSTPASGKAEANEEDPNRSDASRAVQEATLRAYYVRMMTLDDGMPELFSRRVRGEESMAFVMMREAQRRKGLLPRFRAARVYLDELSFTRITADPDLARFRVTGRYSVSVATHFETVEEDALFVLLPEDGGWKIFERREGGD